MLAARAHTQRLLHNFVNIDVVDVNVDVIDGGGV